MEIITKSGMDVVVVESPAKAKTINKYLGSNYTVLASFGHVRDLPPKDGSVRPDEDFAMSWQVSDRAGPKINDIAKALKGADRLYLATDPDREGEAISWHVEQVLRDKGVLKDVDVQRIVFHEITKDAVLDAIAHPRPLNDELVEAYFARRALDYLVGFTLSPVLWRKLPGSKSAGRVQSVALRLICEREAEIEIFNPQEYWSIDVAFDTPRAERFTARLTHLDGEKLDKLGIGNKTRADIAVVALEAGRFRVTDVQKKQVRRNPYPPFTTSTLQQEASRKLRFAASRTMRLAQQLYEGITLDGETVGLITYMRTDSVSLSREAVESSRALIGQKYGGAYVPETPRVYKTKAKNAQEAHEAIRPTDLMREPAEVAGHLEADQLKLYELIWKRTIASAMESARLDQVAVTIDADDKRDEPPRHRLGRGFRWIPRRLPGEPGRQGERGQSRRRVRRRASPAARRGGAKTWPAATSRPSSTSPSRRRATPKRAWSRRWRSSASAGRRPMPRSFRSCRTAATSNSTAGASCPRIVDAS